jgi:hypothetical protein
LKGPNIFPNDLLQPVDAKKTSQQTKTLLKWKQGQGYSDTCAAPKALRLTSSLQVDVFVLAKLQGAARTFLLDPQGLQ